MRAVKGNKEYTIDEAQQKGYQDAGFDILDDEGRVIAFGRGKTVPYGDYAELKAENEVLNEELEELEAELGELKAELATLKAEKPPVKPGSEAPKAEKETEDAGKKADSKKAGE